MTLQLVPVSKTAPYALLLTVLFATVTAEKSTVQKSF